MFTGVWQSAVILGTFIAFYVVDVWLMRRFDPLRAQGSSRAWDYTILILLAGAFLVIQPFVWPGIGFHTDALWGLSLQIVGLLLTLGALALHLWARMNLRQFYGEREEVQQGQFLIESGPYAYIRHPIYTSYYTYAVGLLLVNPSLSMLLAAIYAFVDFSLAVRREEKLLRQDLPGYADYIARTSRFLPRLRQGSKGGGL
jgi:protein-S-isoprenylcysteine O-methyltransferase Ste14